MISRKNQKGGSLALGKNVGLYKSPMEMKHWEKTLSKSGFSVFFLELIHSRILDEGDTTQDVSNGQFSLFTWLEKWKKCAEQGVFANFQAFCVIFTSQRAVDFFFDFARKICKNIDFLSAFSFLSLGRGTSEALQKQGIFSYFQAENPNQEGVFAQARKIHRLYPQTIFFYFCSIQARTFLVDQMRKENITCHDIPFYRTDALLWQKAQWNSFRQLNLMVLGSSSAVNALKKNFLLQINGEENNFSAGSNVFARHPLYVLLGRASEESFLAFRQFWWKKTGQRLSYVVLKKPSVEGMLEMFAQ